MTRTIRLADAFPSGLIINAALNNIVGRIYVLLIKIDIDKTRIHFLQRVKNERVHYTQDC